MRKVTTTDARRGFGKVLRRAERGDRVVIHRYGKPAAVFVPIHDLELIEQLASEGWTRKSSTRRKEK